MLGKNKVCLFVKNEMEFLHIYKLPLKTVVAKMICVTNARTEQCQE